MRPILPAYHPSSFCFNPRICKRCDLLCDLCFLVAVVSIHASVKDATSDNDFVLDAAKGFNPRICKRCDAFYRDKTGIYCVSIHASVKDATANF